jgi:hypothetical protein
MDIQINYYSLINAKDMGDGNTIPQGQDLIFIKKDDDGLMFFETYGADCKMLFWSREDEVQFEQTSMETWSEEKLNERNRYINGEFI